MYDNRPHGTRQHGLHDLRFPRDHLKHMPSSTRYKPHLKKKSESPQMIPIQRRRYRMPRKGRNLSSHHRH